MFDLVGKSALLDDVDAKDKIQIATVNAKSKSGETALKFAEVSERNDIIDLLKENGAKE